MAPKPKAKHDKPPPPKTDPPVDTPVDPFAALFAEFDADSQYVNLSRIKPTEFQDVPISGYLERLVPGADEQYLKDRYGGGKYMIQKKDASSHKIIATRYVEISGFPKVPLATPPVVSPDDVAGSLESIPVDIGGVSVPFTGDMTKMKEMMLFVKMLKDVFPEPPSINDVLLKMVLDQQSQPDPLEQLLKLKEITGALTPETGASGTGPWDILASAITQAGGVIQKMMIPGGAPPGRVPGAALAKTPVPKAVEAPDNIETLDQSGVEIPDGLEVPMSQQEAVMAVVAVFVKCWRLSPPMEVAKVVGMVDMILRQESPTIRSALVSQFNETIISVSETELVDDWSDPETKVGSREAFSEYCTQIFDSYADVERKVELL